MRISDWSSDVCSSDLEPRNLAAADENRNAEQRYAQHDRYIDADEMAADIDTIGRNKAGHPKNYEDIVDATADQIADRDVTLIPDRRYDRGHEFGRRGTHGNDRQADAGVRYIPGPLPIYRAGVV